MLKSLVKVHIGIDCLKKNNSFQIEISLVFDGQQIHEQRNLHELHHLASSTTPYNNTAGGVNGEDTVLEQAN